MSYIPPNSTVRLIKNCPLSSDYEHTIYFANSNSQYSYFSSLSGFTLNNQMYQRVDKGIFKCELAMSNIYDCNYMMFKNSSFENFWFYAFIDKIEYQNNGLGYVYFTIDVIQTWFIQKLTLGECFVEREHSVSDGIGEHIEGESFSLGDYVNNDSIKEIGTGEDDDTLTSYAIVIAITDTTQDKGAQGHLYDGVYSGSTLYAYKVVDYAKANAKINEYVNDNKADAITSIYLVPQKFIVSKWDTESGLIQNTYESSTIAYSVNSISTNDTIDGYKPKNNKLYTYPYNYLSVFANTSNEMTIRYEFCNNLTPKFIARCCTMAPVQMILQPVGYKNSEQANSDITLSVGNLPLCSWNYDAYQAWLAQAQYNEYNSFAKNVVTNAVSGGLSGAIYGSLGGGFGTALGGALGLGLGVTSAVVSSIASGLMNEDIASHSADTLNGSNCGNVNASSKKATFFQVRKSITSQMAKRVDDFFNAYGYKCGRLKVPNISSRPYWNFIKTANCELSGSAPNDDITKIKQIFNSGITFWKSASYMYNYDLDNSPS